MAEKEELTDNNIKNAVALWCEDCDTATARYGHISEWDTCAVTNMRGLFEEQNEFNADIITWNVESVRDMSSMFYNASSFDQPLSAWNVKGVRDMSSMFQGASAFNQSLGSWKVDGVRDMRFMFAEASSFNQPLGSWNVKGVRDMMSMFEAASTFNQSFESLKSLMSWNLSEAVWVDGMFGDQRHSIANNGCITTDPKQQLSDITHWMLIWIFLNKRHTIKELILPGNRINHLPDTIGELEALEVIDLRYNQLTKLPESLVHLKQLHTLRVEGNPLEAQLKIACEQGVKQVQSYLCPVKVQSTHHRLSPSRASLFSQVYACFFCNMRLHACACRAFLVWIHAHSTFHDDDNTSLSTAAIV